MTKRDVLVAAKGYLVRRGWAQEYGVDGSPRCVLGAISSVCPDVELQALAGAGLMTAAGVKRRLSVWNDAPGRTLDEVVDVLDRAILEAAPEDTPEPSPSVTRVFA